jgi:restriction endonuclease S subunit
MAVWSEVDFSALTEDRRIDAEHYRPEYLAQAKRIAGLPHKQLWEIADISDGNHISIAESFVDDGIRYLRGQDLSDFFIADKTPVFIPQSTYDALKRSHMRPGDILLGIVATIGTVSLVTNRFGKLTGNCKIGIIRPKNIESEFLATFFLSALGQREIHRWARGTVQTGVILPDLKRLPIPIISASIRSGIAEQVCAALSRKEECTQLLADAETALDEALGLTQMDLTPHLFYEARYADASAACRIDADYFQPAKRTVLAALSRMGGESIGRQFRSVRQLWQPDRMNPADAVRNYDLTDALSGFLDDTLEPTTAAQIGSTKKAFAPGDLVISRLRSYLKEIAIVLPGGETPLVGSSEFIVLRPKQNALPVEALLVYLRSPYVQTILKWCQDGSNHPRFDEKELLAIPVPDKVMSIGKELTAKVKNALTARRESRRLLDTAKRTVEVAIEESEAAALRFLKEQQG